METESNEKTSLRKRADVVKEYRCKNLIAVIEAPKDVINIGTIIRNVDAFGVDKTYIIDPHHKLPDDWQEMRDRKSLKTTSVSAVKWNFIKRFNSTEDCLEHLEKNDFVSVVTSPHIKGKVNHLLHEGSYTQPKLAVWFGNESRGVSELAVDRSDFCINIPMMGMIESLNLGTSSGIVLYEVTKQRRSFKNKK